MVRCHGGGDVLVGQSEKTMSISIRVAWYTIPIPIPKYIYIYICINLYIYLRAQVRGARPQQRTPRTERRTRARQRRDAGLLPCRLWMGRRSEVSLFTSKLYCGSQPPFYAPPPAHTHAKPTLLRVHSGWGLTRGAKSEGGGHTCIRRSAGMRVGCPIGYAWGAGQRRGRSAGIRASCPVGYAWGAGYRGAGIWPLHDISLVRSLCTRIKYYYYRKHPFCLGPTPTFTAHTIAQYSGVRLPSLIAMRAIQYWRWQYRVKVKRACLHTKERRDSGRLPCRVCMGRRSDGGGGGG